MRASSDGPLKGIAAASLVLGGAPPVIGFITFLVGPVADLIKYDRQLIEMTLEKVRRMELNDATSAPRDTDQLR